MTPQQPMNSKFILSVGMGMLFSLGAQVELRSVHDMRALIATPNHPVVLNWLFTSETRMVERMRHAQRCFRAYMHGQNWAF